jgi:hypothetical protein
MREGKEENIYKKRKKKKRTLFFFLRLTEFSQYRVNRLKSLINLFSHFGTGQYDFTRHKDEQDNLWLDHTIDETRKQFRFILLYPLSILKKSQKKTKQKLTELK